METFSTLIERIGGAAKVAAFTGEKPGTVQQRKARNNFPPETWPKLIEFAHSEGFPEVDEAFLVKVAIASKEADQQSPPADAAQQDAA